MSEMTTLKLKYPDLISFIKILETSLDNKIDSTFRFYLTKLKLQIFNDLQEIQRMEEPTKDFLEYKSEISKLLVRYALKNEDGSFITDKNNNIKINPDKLEDFEREKSDITKKYMDVLIKRNQQIDEVSYIKQTKIYEYEFPVFRFFSEGINTLPQTLYEIMIKLECII